jgi:predicted small lipoprotein YifL
MTSMRTILPATAAAAVLSTALAACSTTAQLTKPDDAITAKEQEQVAALKPRYKDVVTGTDVKGTMLIVFVDVNNLDSMDEPAEDAMKADTLARWKRIWGAAHPGKHAKLTVILRDYFGNEVFRETTRA